MTRLYAETGPPFLAFLLLQNGQNLTFHLQREKRNLFILSRFRQELEASAPENPLSHPASYKPRLRQELGASAPENPLTHPASCKPLTHPYMRGIEPRAGSSGETAKPTPAG